MDLEGLTALPREALAIDAAGLLRQCIGGLPSSPADSQRTEERIRLSLRTLRDTGKNPFALQRRCQRGAGHLLRDGKPGQLSGEQAVARSFRPRTRWRCSAPARRRCARPSSISPPQQLALRFERDGRRPLLATSGNAAGVPTVATTSRYARTTIGASVC